MMDFETFIKLWPVLVPAGLVLLMFVRSVTEHRARQRRKRGEGGRR